MLNVGPSMLMRLKILNPETMKINLRVKLAAVLVITMLVLMLGYSYFSDDKKSQMTKYRDIANKRQRVGIDIDEDVSSQSSGVNKWLEAPTRSAAPVVDSSSRGSPPAARPPRSSPEPPVLPRSDRYDHLKVKRGQVQVQKTDESLMSKLDTLTKALVFVMNLKSTEAKVYSQNLEDGVLLAIFKQIGVKYKYYVEFGVENGKECNTRVFREHEGWTGLLMDGGNHDPSINLQKEMIYPTNIVALFQKYKVPKQFDLLSVDTDFKDFWLTQKILAAGYRPRVIISEINSFLGPVNSKTVPMNWSETRGDFSRYYGFSVTAGWHLGRYYGYSMVYCETAGVNCMWVIDGEEGFGKGIKVSNYLKGSSLWEPSCCLPHKPDTKNRPYTSITADTKFS